jgi:hypothetical protein
MKIDPFNDGDTFSTFRNILENTKQEIQSLNNEYVIKASQTELEDYYTEKARVESLALYGDQHYIENHTATKIDVKNDFNRSFLPGRQAVVQGTHLDIAIPYDGDPMLWKLRASTFSLSDYPKINVRDNLIIFSIEFADDSANSEKIKLEIDRQIQLLVSAVNHISYDVASHNNSIAQVVKDAIQRKQRLAESAIGAVASLGIPIKQRDRPLTYTVPTKRRESPVRKPSVSKEAYKLEPVLIEKEYDHILDIMKSMSLVIERSPNAFTTLDEEAIRTHFLLQLNGHYEGDATGETFNASGKTDILIRVENRNIFIAECKFWRGPKSFNDAIDQLLSYLSWRDSKSALLVFNKTKDSGSVRQKMHEAIESRSEHKKTVKHDLAGDSRYIFVKESEPGREIIITTQLYDIPIAE